MRSIYLDFEINVTLIYLFISVFPDLPIVTLPKGTVVKGPLEKACINDCLRGEALFNQSTSLFRFYSHSVYCST
jgi:hypothetical protein